MSEWLSRPEWGQLLAHLRSIRLEASAALEGADPNSIACVARLQAELRTLDYFLEGSAREALLSEQKEKEKSNNE